jgi:hypothetical protein
MTRHDQDAELEPIANRLRDESPVPRAGFRAELRGRLLEVRRAPSQRVRLLVAVYAGSGLALLAIAAIGAAGGGPLAAS